MTELRDKVAAASGRWPDWDALVESNDPFDHLTVTNAYAVADNILAEMPEIAEALALKAEIDGEPINDGIERMSVDPKLWSKIHFGHSTLGSKS